MEARIHNNRIVLAIGTAIGFKMIAKNYQKFDLKVTESQEDSKFCALFDENDVDFEIEINNSKCIHGIGYTLIVNNGFYDYYIGPREVWSMEALYSRGRKLHFISEKSEEGKDVIKDIAQEFDISYSESAAVCSRIEFNFEVEKTAPKPTPAPPPPPMSSPKAPTKSMKKMFSLSSCFPSDRNTLGSSSSEELYAKSSNRRSSASPDLSYNLVNLNEDVADFGAEANLCSDSVESLKQTSKKRLFARPPSHLAAISDSAMVIKPQSLAKPFVETETNAPKESEKSDRNEIGDKGVVCFGEESNQLYNPFGGFAKDNDLVIKPFVVELRFSKK